MTVSHAFFIHDAQWPNLRFDQRGSKIDELFFRGTRWVPSVRQLGKSFMTVSVTHFSILMTVSVTHISILMTVPVTHFMMHSGLISWVGQGPKNRRTFFQRDQVGPKCEAAG
jgi:hypothetical protein